MSLTTAEVQQCKHFLGYGNLTVLARPYFDIAIVFEDVVAQNIDNTWAENYIRNTILANLLSIDVSIQGTGSRFIATELVGEVKLNTHELEKWLELKAYWVNELSMALKVPTARPLNMGGQVELE